MLKINNSNTRKKCEICSKLTMNTPERSQLRRSGAFLLILNICFTPSSNVTISKVTKVKVKDKVTNISILFLSNQSTLPNY